MKKIIALIVVVAFTTSCKKVRTCNCTDVDTGPSGTETTKWTYSIKMKKRDAKNWCEGYNSSSSSGGYTSSTTCELS